MKHINTSIREFIKESLEVNIEYEAEARDILVNIIEGYPTKLSDLEVIYDYFDGDIDEEVKYSGILYRYMFFEHKNEYKSCLINGIKCKDDSFLRCTKTLDNKELILDQLGAGYEYYVVFEIFINEDECIFDINELSKILNVDNYYEHEEEVIIKCVDLLPRFIYDKGRI